FTVIGVAPAAQRYPVTAELWMPKQFAENELSDRTRGARWLGVLARVKDDVSLDAASGEVLRISEMMETRFPEDYRERRAHLVTVRDILVGDMRKPLYIVLGAVLFVLLIACANVANLLLVRATARETEIAVRTALGAGRGRLVRQLITESVILAAFGAVVGIVIAKIGMSLLLSRAPQSFVLIGNASIDGTTLLVTAALAILTGLIFGTLPALQSTNPHLATALRAGGRGARGRASANRTKRTIVVAELALAVMLLSGAGLLLRSFSRLISVDTGFRPEGVLSMKVNLPAASYDSTATRTFIHAISRRLQTLPGVQSVGIADAIPFDGAGNNFSFIVRGRSYPRASDQPSTEVRVVTPGFFPALRVPLVRGRVLAEGDSPGAPRVLVVNQTFANRFFPGENVIGQAIRLGWGNDPKDAMSQIVGVVGDVQSDALGADPSPTVYASYMQYPQHTVSLLLRTHAPPASLAPPVRSVVRELDRELPVYSVQSMDERVAASVGPQRFYATLIAIFAGVALVLAAVGLYGVIAYAVSQRTHELGVRVALGATTDRIAAMVVREGLALTALGLVVGIIGSIAAGRLIATLLYGVSARDPFTLIGVAVALGIVATLASWLPARRAARVDPLVAMRGD
ncbi:MAG TPA: ABC transporter permease, partial [Gemmatimonadaceae bacterium]